ncbi:MAG: hypothetical protein ACYDAG_18740 [Chloroflexota bacterium]
MREYFAHLGSAKEEHRTALGVLRLFLFVSAATHDEWRHCAEAEELIRAELDELHQLKVQVRDLSTLGGAIDPDEFAVHAQFLTDLILRWGRIGEEVRLRAPAQEVTSNVAELVALARAHWPERHRPDRPDRLAPAHAAQRS